MSWNLAKLGCPIALLCVAPGCGDDCASIESLTINPASATISHSAAPPGNTQNFAALPHFRCGTHTQSSLGDGVTWTTSDPVNTSISGTGTGTATCINATSGPVTITATTAVRAGSSRTVSATTPLTCN